jgi:hypothetical protein
MQVRTTIESNFKARVTCSHTHCTFPRERHRGATPAQVTQHDQLCLLAGPLTLHMCCGSTSHNRTLTAHSHTHTLTHSLTYSLAHSLTHSLTRSLAHSLTHSTLPTFLRKQRARSSCSLLASRPHHHSSTLLQGAAGGGTITIGARQRWVHCLALRCSQWQERGVRSVDRVASRR